MMNSRALGSLLQRLQRETDYSEGKDEGQPSAIVQFEPHDSTTTEMKETPVLNQEKESCHPKAIGSLLKMLQSDKDNFNEEPSSSKSGETTFVSPYVRDLQDDDDEDGECELKKKDSQQKQDEFYCSLCDISCTSQIVMDTHLAGKKHNKKVAQLIKKTAAFPQEKKTIKSEQCYHAGAEIQRNFEELSESEPVIGLEYITEYQKSNGIHRYFCEMCEVKSSKEEMLDHVIGRQHRLRFMRAHCFDIYYKITGYPLFKDMMRPSEADKLLRRHSSFVVRMVLRSVLRQCKIRQYTGESFMRVYTDKRHKPGAVHPSQHKDLPRAEQLLRQGEVKESEQRAKEIAQRRKEALTQRKELLHPFEAGYHGLAAGYGKSELLKDDHLYYDDQTVLSLAGSYVLDEAQCLERRLRTERALKLDQQELRITNALRTLHESCGGQAMTHEETVASTKLKTLLSNIRAEKKSGTQLGAQERLLEAPQHSPMPGKSQESQFHEGQSRTLLGHGEQQGSQLHHAHPRTKEQMSILAHPTSFKSSLRRQPGALSNFADRLQTQTDLERSSLSQSQLLLEKPSEHERPPSESVPPKLRKVVEPIGVQQGSQLHHAHPRLKGYMSPLIDPAPSKSFQEHLSDALSNFADGLQTPTDSERSSLSQNQSLREKPNEYEQPKSKSTLSNLRKVVEPIIEKTKQKVEQKIFQALSGGNLASLTEMFKNNPELQATLKQWEQNQSPKNLNADEKRINQPGTKIVEKPRFMQVAEGELNASSSHDRPRKRRLMADPRAVSYGSDSHADSVPSKSYNEPRANEYSERKWNDGQYGESLGMTKKRPTLTGRLFDSTESRPMLTDLRDQWPGTHSVHAVSYKDRKEWNDGQSDESLGMTKERSTLTGRLFDSTERRPMVTDPLGQWPDPRSAVASSYDDGETSNEYEWNDEQRDEPLGTAKKWQTSTGPLFVSTKSRPMITDARGHWSDQRSVSYDDGEERGHVWSRRQHDESLGMAKKRPTSTSHMFGSTKSKPILTSPRDQLPGTHSVLTASYDDRDENSKHDGQRAESLTMTKKRPTLTGRLFGSTKSGSTLAGHHDQWPNPRSTSSASYENGEECREFGWHDGATGNTQRHCPRLASHDEVGTDQLGWEKPYDRRFGSGRHIPGLRIQKRHHESLQHHRSLGRQDPHGSRPRLKPAELGNKSFLFTDPLD